MYLYGNKEGIIPIESAAMKRARGIAVVGVCALAVLSVAVRINAEPVSQLHATNYVNDFSHVVSPDTTAELNDIAQQVDQKAKAQIADVTVNGFEDRDIDSDAVDLL